jgi:hypothetical protein
MSAERDPDRPGEGGDVHHHVRVEHGVRVGEDVGQHQTALGVGVEHLDGTPAVLRDHVARPLGRARRHVLGRRHQAGDTHPGPQLAQRAHDGDHRAAARHVGLLQLHVLSGLERQPPGVEGDSLAHQHDVAFVRASPWRLVGELDEPRRIHRPLPHGEDPAEALRPQLVGLPHLGRKARLLGDLDRAPGQPLGVLGRRRRVGQVPGERGGTGDHLASPYRLACPLRPGEPDPPYRLGAARADGEGVGAKQRALGHRRPCPVARVLRQPHGQRVASAGATCDGRRRPAQTRRCVVTRAVQQDPGDRVPARHRDLDDLPRIAFRVILREQEVRA